MCATGSSKQASRLLGAWGMRPEDVPVVALARARAQMAWVVGPEDHGGPSPGSGLPAAFVAARPEARAALFFAFLRAYACECVCV